MRPILHKNNEKKKRLLLYESEILLVMNYRQNLKQSENSSHKISLSFTQAIKKN